MNACQSPTTPAPRIAIDFGFCVIVASISDGEAFAPFVGAAFEALVGHGDDVKPAGERRALHPMSERAHVGGEPIDVGIGLEDEFIASRAEIDQVGCLLRIEMPVDEADQTLYHVEDDRRPAGRAEHETNLSV